MKLKHFTGFLTGVIMTVFFCMTVSAGIQPVKLGEKMEDFTVETANAGTFTLSKKLEEYKMVFINLWGIFCGPCEMEMPYMQEAYTQYSDKVAMIALSIDPGDTPEKIVEYANELGLTFPMGSDSETGIFRAIGGNSVPTSIVVDRFGNVAMIAVGAEFATSRFTSMFDFFLSDDYTETVTMDQFPEEKPVQGVSEEELSENANAEGSDLKFGSNNDPLAWPAVPEEHEGRKAVTFSNTGKAATTGSLTTTVNASKGDALAFDFCSVLDNSPGYDKLDVLIGEECMLSVYESYDWTTFAIPLSEGENEVIFLYNSIAGKPENKVWLSNIHTATGDEAQSLLESMPANGTADEFAIAVKGDLQPVVLAGEGFEDQAWVTDEDSVTLHVSLPGDQNPLRTNFQIFDKDFPTTLRTSPMASLFKRGTPSGDGYDLTIPIEEGEFVYVTVAPGLEMEDTFKSKYVMVANGEQGIEGLIEFQKSFSGVDIGWHYAEEDDTVSSEVNDSSTAIE